jgi:hypothetical protein
VDRELVEVAAPMVADARPGAPRTVLLVAYHFPPLRGSSGLQRTLRFAQHLPKFGWRPIVLSINPRAYEEVGATGGNEVPPELTVHRAFGLNAASQLSIFGRYLKAFALPDRWASWRLWAVPKALNIIRSERVDVLWTTFPVATAHRIGVEVARRTRLPWVAEFRDPMWQSDWPPEPAANAAWRRLEQDIFTTADWAVFTAPSAVDMYAQRFPDFERSRLIVIENGYDEDTFKRAEKLRESGEPRQTRSQLVTLLHSGIIYRSERDPTHFFAAVASLKAKGAIDAGSFRIILRASGAEMDYSADLERLGIADVVRLEPAIGYVAALQEMLTVDGLLVLQAANCDAQIPAKIYEYMRAGRPILALTNPIGDTARTLSAVGGCVVAPLDSAAQIEAALLRFVIAIREGRAVAPPAARVARYSREAQAGELAQLLEQAASARGEL